MKADALWNTFVRVLALAAPAAAVGGCGSNPGGCGSVIYDDVVLIVTIDASASDDGEAGAVPADAGFGFATCQTLCPYDAGPANTSPVSCEPDSQPDAGANQLVCHYVTRCAGGRRPARWSPRLTPATDPLGRHFAELAQLEAASVDAFRSLREELRLHRAPRALLRAASRARHDEVRHARTTARIAERHGATVPPVAVPTRTPRSLEDIAVENAVEGCVRETYGALLAAYQAQHAADATVRAAMARIARDETRHAALAWSVRAWAARKLPRESRARVTAAMHRAVAQLRAEARATTNLDGALSRDAGLPDADTARGMIDALDSALWTRDRGAGAAACSA